MQNLHESSCFSIFFDSESKLFHYVFNAQTEFMTADGYIDELKTFIQLIEEHKPIKVLGDMIDFKFMITPDIQAWVAEHLFTVYEEIGFQKIAILLSEEFIAGLSIEQTMDEGNQNSFQTSYFDNAEDAMKWLQEEA